ncbi:hypothetical protein BsWGS_12904 [Bradybaena similaris]
MAADEKQVSALIRRHEQVKRWEGSDTNLEPSSPKKNRTKVQFQDGCVFLAACSSGDKEEVEKLLQRGADINTANVDGLTALHQACIDDNLEMVEFLVEKGADVDVCDNEGWTPLHATASCAFTEIARYLINHNANVAAVNNDGDLPIDIAENDEMENLLQDEMNKRDIDADAARCEEEQRMLEDANKWLRDKTVEEIQHPKTGATALHVAAAKGYLKVMNVLLEAGVDVNAEDYDGWTPLHAAAHWGQEEACKVLVEHNCDMMHKNKAGHTAFDLAEKEMLKLLEELKEKQASARSKQEIDREIILPSGHGGKRRSSVTRMSGDQKQNVIQRTSEEERAALSSLHPGKTDDKILNSISLTEDKFVEDPLTERENEKNKQVSQQSQQLPTSTTVSTTTATSWSRPASIVNSTAGVEVRWTDMPKIEEVTETDRQSKGVVIPTTTAAAATTAPTKPPVAATLPSEVQPAAVTNTTTVLTPRPSVSISKVEKRSDANDDSAVQDSSSSNLHPASPTTSSQHELSLPSWRQGLRKTGSTSMVHERMAQTDSNNLPRSSSTPRLVLDSRLESLHERLAHSRLPSDSTTAATTSAPSSTTITSTDTEGKPGDSEFLKQHRAIYSRRNSYTFGQSYLGYRGLYGGRTGSYLSSYQQRQQQRDSLVSSEDRVGSAEVGRIQDRLSFSGTTTTTTSSSATTPSPNYVTAATTVTTSTSTTSSVLRRSYEPPKRDEETETQRKARAKHARQTRRSTQGVSLEDIEKAEESLKADKDSTDANTTSSHLLPSRNSLISKGNVSAGSGEMASTTGISTATTTTTIPSTVGGSDGDTKEDRSVMSGYRLRAAEDKNDSAEVSSTRSNYRRAREEKDTNASSGVTSTYIPRSQRSSVQQPTDTSLSSQNLLRSSSLRTNRQVDQVIPRAEEETKKDETNGQDKKEDKKEPSSIRARRQRRERRSTGIVMDNEDGETNKDNKTDEDKKEDDGRTNKESKPDEDKKDYNLGSSRYGRYNSNSDFPSQRPVSYSEVSKSTGSLDIDYKKKYEEEKTENDRLRKELEETKKHLLEAKAELDRVMKQKDAARNSDRDKRALERKLSEMEEELKKMETLKADNQRLKDENGALIRVISKLSK